MPKPTQAELDAAFAEGQRIGRLIFYGAPMEEIRKALPKKPDLRTHLGRRLDAGVRSITKGKRQ